MSIKVRKFRQFIREKKVNLNEDLFSKAYAIAQSLRFNADKSKLASQYSQVRNSASRAKSAEEQTQKIDFLANAVEEAAKLILLFAEQTSHIMNTTVVSAVLSDDLKSTLCKELEKFARKN